MLLGWTTRIVPGTSQVCVFIACQTKVWIEVVLKIPQKGERRASASGRK